MAHGPRYRVKRRRRREGKTDYKVRLALLKSGKARVVVRRSLRNVVVQFVLYDEVGDRVVAQAEAQELAGMGWTGNTSNTPAAYLAGLLAGTRAVEEGVEEGVLDLGRQVPAPGGNVFAALQGVVDAGVDVPHGEGIFPSEDRVRGEHIGDDAVREFNKVYAAITGEELEAEEAEGAGDADSEQSEEEDN